MWGFDRVETCKLVGLYILDTLSVLLRKESLGLLWDDGLAVAKNASGPRLDESN